MTESQSWYDAEFASFVLSEVLIIQNWQTLLEGIQKAQPPSQTLPSRNLWRLNSWSQSLSGLSPPSHSKNCGYVPYMDKVELTAVHASET